jgi:hypothetical protein
MHAAETRARPGRVILLAAFGLLLVMMATLASCVTARLPNVPLTLQGAAASPPALAAFGADPAVTTAAEWTSRRVPALRDVFQREVFGMMPAPANATITRRVTIDAPALAGRAVVEQWTLGLDGPASGMGYTVLVILPAGSTGPVPVLMMQNFCGNSAALPGVAGVAGPMHGNPRECSGGMMAPLVPMIFGEHITVPPYETILARGYGLAMFYAGDVVPDDPVGAEPPLAQLTPAGTAPSSRTGAIAAWAWLYSTTAKVLRQDPRIDGQRLIAWGHSRNGKAAILAAAFDPSIAAVVALQPGTGGAALTRDGVGETVGDITASYPHWFAPAYAAWAGREAALPVDQHQLLGLAAPTPILINVARRDQWGDPQGSWQALEGARPVYALFGPLPQPATAFPDPELRPPLGFTMRPGLHGIHAEDWTATLAFLDAALAR